MEDMLKKPTLPSSPSSPSEGALGMHKNSQIIAKMKPKIRIIHIFAPEIIKTDVANFRELVQRLTGKPTPHEMARKNSSSMTANKRPRKSSTTTTKNIDHSSSSSSSRSPGSGCRLSTAATINNNNFSHHPAMIHKPSATKFEVRSGFLKGEEEIWRNANSGGGYLGGFAELEGFMEQLHHEFPLLPAITMEAAAPVPPTLLNY